MSVTLLRILLTKSKQEVNTFVASSILIVKKNGLQTLLEELEQVESLGRIGSIM